MAANTTDRCLWRPYFQNRINASRQSRIILKNSDTSSSLALQSCKFGLGFLHDSCPFCSVYSSCSPLFHTHNPHVHSDIIQPPLPRSCCLPSPGSPSSTFFAVLSLSILTTSTYLHYSSNIWRFQFIINFMTRSCSPQAI